SPGSLLDVLSHAAPRLCLAFMNAAQRLATAFMELHSLSCGVVDIVPPREALAAARAVVARDLARVRREQRALHRGEAPRALYEARALAALSLTLGATATPFREAEAALPHARANAFDTMAESGAKGSPLNRAQVSCCVGQQTVERRR